MQVHHVDDLVDAYALGALEPAEMAAVEQHLAGCEQCRALASESANVAEQLLYPTQLVAPPAALRERVLARVAAEASGSSVDLPPQTGAAPLATTGNAELDEPITPSGPVRRFLRRLLSNPEEEAADRLLGELLSDPACVIWQVPATDAMPGASARLVGSPARHEAVIVTNGLRPVPASQAYQVWFLAGGQPVPNALFRVRSNGRARARVQVTEPLHAYDTVAITPEPARGSPSPTGPIVLAGALAQQ